MDPLTMAAVAAGSQAVGGLVQGITGAFQKGKAKRMARANKRPVYKIQQPIKDNQALVESRVGQGLSDAALTVYRQNNERGLTSAIDAILAGGGSVNNIADIYGTFQDGTGKMALIDEEMRTRNVQNLITQNNALAGEMDKEWQVNIYAPYADKAQAAAALSKQGTDNMWKGINTVVSAGANYATSQQYANQAAGVYGNNGVLPTNAGNGQLPQNTGQQQWNWYTPNTPTPQLPVTGQQQINQGIQTQFPGLMFNSGTSAADWEAGIQIDSFGG